MGSQHAIVNNVAELHLRLYLPYARGSGEGYLWNGRTISAGLLPGDTLALLTDSERLHVANVEGRIWSTGVHFTLSRLASDQDFGEEVQCNSTLIIELERYGNARL